MAKDPDRLQAEIDRIDRDLANMAEDMPSPVGVIEVPLGSYGGMNLPGIVPDATENAD